MEVNRRTKTTFTFYDATRVSLNHVYPSLTFYSYLLIRWNLATLTAIAIKPPTVTEPTSGFRYSSTNCQTDISFSPAKVTSAASATIAVYIPLLSVFLNEYVFILFCYLLTAYLP